MNGPQDMGGRQGFGPVAPEKGEPVFHADWEKRALALTLAMGAAGKWTLDESRHARETLPPAEYLLFSYYEIWIAALTKLLIRHGLVTEEEASSGVPTTPAASVKGVLQADAVADVLSRGGPTDRSSVAPARFAPGDRVTARLQSPPGHTRLPAYATGRPGRVHAVHGVHVFPDTNAHGGGEHPQWLYSVRFAAHDLWGPDTTASDIFVDLWEPYLDAA